MPKATSERAVDIVLQFHRLAPCEENGNGEIEREVKQQEGLGRGKMFGLIEPRPPKPGDDGGEYQAEQVQRPPRLVPGNGGDAKIEHEVVGEQHHVTACSG
jgi:hypothetical protein